MDTDISIVGGAGKKAERGTGAAGLDWEVAASALFVGGAWLDAWAHDDLPATLETFSTPWHAVLYAGLLAAATLFWTAIRNRARGDAWRGALPDGYGLSALAGAVGLLVASLAAPPEAPSPGTPPGTRTAP